jgi:hypothetical protein
MRILKLIVGIVLVLLGLLWALQGADLIHIEPVMCVANCEPLIGGSTTWLITGVLVMVAGAGMLYTLKRKRV